MWTQKPSDNLVEAVGTPVQFPSAGTFRRIHLPAAKEKVSAEDELAAVEVVAAAEELAAVEDLDAVEEQRGGVVPSQEEASGLAGSS